MEGSFLLPYPEQQKKKEARKKEAKTATHRTCEKRERGEPICTREKQTLRRSLREFYNDIEYLEKIFKDKGPVADLDETTKSINEKACDGLHYLYSRAEFWHQQNPLLPPQRKWDKMRQLTKTKEIQEAVTAEERNMEDKQKTVSLKESKLKDKQDPVIEKERIGNQKTVSLESSKTKIKQEKVSSENVKGNQKTLAVEKSKIKNNHEVVSLEESNIRVNQEKFSSEMKDKQESISLKVSEMGDKQETELLNGSAEPQYEEDIYSNTLIQEPKYENTEENDLKAPTINEYKFASNDKDKNEENTNSVRSNTNTETECQTFTNGTDFTEIDRTETRQETETFETHHEEKANEGNCAEPKTSEVNVNVESNDKDSHSECADLETNKKETSTGTMDESVLSALVMDIQDRLEQIDNGLIDGHYEKSLEKAQETLGLVELTEGDEIPNRHELIAQLHTKLGRAYLEIGQLDKGMDHTKQAMELATKHDLEDQKAMTLDNLGKAYAKSGNLERAIEVWQEKIPLTKSPAERAWLFHEMGWSAFELGQYSKARDFGASSLQAAEEAGDPSWQLHSSVLLAQSEAQLEEYKQAKRAFEKALEVAREQNNTEAEAALQQALADIDQKLVDEEESSSINRDEDMISIVDEVDEYKAPDNTRNTGQEVDYREENGPRKVD